MVSGDETDMVSVDASETDMVDWALDAGLNYCRLQITNSNSCPLHTITRYLAGGKDDSSVDAPIVFHFSLLSWGFHKALLTRKCACRNSMLIQLGGFWTWPLFLEFVDSTTGSKVSAQLITRNAECECGP